MSDASIHGRIHPVEAYGASTEPAMPQTPLVIRLALFFTVACLVLITASRFSGEQEALVAQFAMVIPGLAVLLVGFLGSGWRIRLPVESLFTLFFCLWCTTGFFITDERMKVIFIGGYITLIKTVALYLLFVNSVRSRQDFLWMAAAYVLCVAAFVLFKSSETMVMTRSLVTGLMKRAGGLTGDANGGAMMAIMCALCALACFSAARNRTIRFLCLAVIPLFVYVVFVSGSRSGMLGSILVAGLVYWWYVRGQLQGRSAGAKLGGVMIGALVVLIISYILISGPFWTRIERTFGLGHYASRGGQVEEDPRAKLAVGGLILFARHPLFGVGYDGYRVFIGEVMPAMIGKVSHNTWVEVAANTGLPGLALWATATLLLTRRAWKLRKNPHLPLADRGIVSLCLVFLVFWWFRSFMFVHLGDKLLLPFVGGVTGYLVALTETYGLGEEGSYPYGISRP